MSLNNFWGHLLTVIRALWCRLEHFLWHMSIVVRLRRPCLHFHIPSIISPFYQTVGFLLDLFSSRFCSGFWRPHPAFSLLAVESRAANPTPTSSFSSTSSYISLLNPSTTFFTWTSPSTSWLDSLHGGGIYKNLGLHHPTCSLRLQSRFSGLLNTTDWIRNHLRKLGGVAIGSLKWYPRRCFSRGLCKWFFLHCQISPLNFENRGVQKLWNCDRNISK